LYDGAVRARLALLLSALAVSVACSRAAPRAICMDFDSDGYGVGCAKGPDCDDSDPTQNEICRDAGGGGPDCALRPLAEGCPCERGDRQACYEAPPDTQDVGACKAGTVVCLDGAWSQCDGEILPSFEDCNGRDDDCDGFIDEGVISPCGGCNPDCVGGVWGPPSFPFEADGTLAVDAAGELTLERTAREALTLWVPNTDEGSVSKIDALQAVEVARYRTRGQYPIRVAVDHRGDAWVLDGSQAGVARLTKLAGVRERCRDRNGDGLHTSQGPTDLLALGTDECVLLDLPLGAAGDDARALMLDGAVGPDLERAGNVWIGFAGSQRVRSFDGDSGAQLAELRLPEVQPYAGAFDSFGVLWLVDRAGVLARIEPSDTTTLITRVVVPFACYALEALSIDADERLLLTGSGCENVYSYDPRRAAWRQSRVPDLLSPRAVVMLDPAAWIAYESGQVARVQIDPLSVGASISLNAQGVTPFETIALSADSLGKVWAVSVQGGPNGNGVATRFEPDTMQVSAQVPVGLGPRGGGDLSGLGLGDDYAPDGETSHVFGGCGRDSHSTAALGAMLTHWGSLHVSALMGAGASIDVAIRRANDDAALADQPFQMLGSLPESGPVFPIDVADGGVLEVRVTLHSPAAIGAPRIARVGIEWICPGPD
jgi:streptogramin lyase